MTRNEFLEKFVEILQTEEDVNFETELESLEEWDSLSAMATIALFNNEFGINITHNDITAMKTIEDVAQKAGL